MKAVKASKRAKLKANGKGKAKATRWDSDEESEDDEWEGGEPGVIKVCIALLCSRLFVD